MKTFTSCLLLGAVVVALAMAPTAYAADPGSLYETLILGMSPEHYFPLDETNGVSGVTNLGTNTNALGAGSHVGGLLGFDHGGAFNATGVFPGIPGVDDRNRTASVAQGDAFDGHIFDPTVTTTGTAGRDFRPNMGSGNLALGAYGGSALTGVDFGAGSSSIMPNIGIGPNAEGHENAMTIVAWVMTDSFGDGGFGGNPSRQGRLFNSEMDVVGSGINLTGSGGPALAPMDGTAASVGVGFDHGDSPFGNQERAYQNGQWQLWIFSTHGVNGAQRRANTRAWTRWAEKTNEIQVSIGLGIDSPDRTIIGGRHGNNTAGAQWDGGIDEISIFTRVLHHNEMEKIYVTGSATSTAPLTSTTTGDGFMQTGFGAAVATLAEDGFAYPVVNGALGLNVWSASGSMDNSGNPYAPSQHGLSRQERLRRVIQHDIDLVHSHVRDSRTERVAMYSLEIKSGASLTMHDNSTLLRTFEDASVNGTLVMNGATGTHGPEGDLAGHVFTNKDTLDVGRDLIIGSVADITISDPRFNVLRAEEDVTIAGGTLTVGFDLLTPPALGAQTWEIIQANYDEFAHSAPLLLAGADEVIEAGATSTDYAPGTLSGMFTTVNLPGPIGTRIFSRVYGSKDLSVTLAPLHGNSLPPSVDTLHIILARPGDADLNSVVDAIDLLAASPKFGTTQPANWLEGNWNNTGGSQDLVDAIDLLDASPFFGQTYGEGELLLGGDDTTIGQPVDGNPSICYDYTTGEVTIDTDGNTTNTYVLDSLAGIFTGLAPNFIGGTFFQTDNDFRIAENFHTNLNGVHNLGAVAQAGLNLGFLLNDLTLQGGSAGNPNFQFDLVIKNTPEPSTILLVGLGLLGLVGAAWRRRQRA